MHYALLIMRKETTEPHRSDISLLIIENIMTQHYCSACTFTLHETTQLKQSGCNSMPDLLVCCCWGSILICTVCDCAKRERQTSLNRWENIRLLPVWQASVVTATCCGAALIGICVNGGWAGSCAFCPEKNGSFSQTAPCWEAPVAFSCGQWPGDHHYLYCCTCVCASVGV